MPTPGRAGPGGAGAETTLSDRVLRVRSRCLRSPTSPHCTKVLRLSSGKRVVGGLSSVFESARTRAAVLEIMKDHLVSMALHDPMDSRTANSSAWAKMAAVIMRFSKHPGYKDFQPPSSLSPRQRAIWIVYAFSEVVAPSSPQPQLAVALNAACFSYAERQKETAIAERARTVIDRLLSR